MDAKVNDLKQTVDRRFSIVDAKLNGPQQSIDRAHGGWKITWPLIAGALGSVGTWITTHFSSTPR
ncbi:MAG: hypothetical protein HC909_04275 [Blastochloris sp.]|nr:hypothetical protein [Blastochloris sp.]